MSTRVDQTPGTGSGPTSPGQPPRPSFLVTAWQQWSRSILVPLLAIFTALVISGVIIWISTGDFSKVIGAFTGLWQGAVGSPRNIAGTLMTASPYIFAGLAVALAFKCGLFNIGVEGQLGMGTLAAAWAGFAIKDLPFPLHLIVSIVAGLIAGLIWGAIPGLLKAYTGAHEVIITIMLNYVAQGIIAYFLGGPLKDHSPGNVSARTPRILTSAEMPHVFVGTPWDISGGVIVGIIATVLVYLFLSRTTWGFEIKTVGANPHAARYAGMSVARNIVLAMALSGMLAGAAGAFEVTGSIHRDELGFGVGYGFDAITVALLARTSPFGVIAAALLLGGLKSGASQMQFNTQISGSIISVVQGLILLFVAADVIIRWMYRIKTAPLNQSITLQPAAMLANTDGAEIAFAEPTMATPIAASYPRSDPADKDDSTTNKEERSGEEVFDTELREER